MARVSDSNSLRLGHTTFWRFNDFSVLPAHNFINYFWLEHTFQKLFEITRDKITAFSHVSFKKYNIAVHILLLITATVLWKKKRKRIKTRIFFSLFRNKRFFRRRKYQIKQRIKHSQYNRLLNFFLQQKIRFKIQSELFCQKFSQNLLNNLLITTSRFNSHQVHFSELPFKLKVQNLFSVLDRKYVYMWRAFYNIIYRQMWYARRMRYFISTIKLCFCFMFLPNAQLMVDHIAYLLKKSRKHWQIIKTFQQLFHFFENYSAKFRTIKIIIQGCINDSERTRGAVIGQTSIITQTFFRTIEYALAHAATPYGALGIRCWIVQ